MKKYLTFARVFASTIAGVFLAPALVAFAYTNLTIENNAISSVDPFVTNSTISGAALNLTGSTGFPSSLAYGEAGFLSTLKVKQFYSALLGENLSLDFANSEETAGLQASIGGGDCGTIQFLSASSGLPFLSLLPGDVNISSQDCIDQGWSTLAPGIYLGNGAIDPYSEPILPFENNTIDLGGFNSWRHVYASGTIYAVNSIFTGSVSSSNIGSDGSTITTSTIRLTNAKEVKPSCLVLGDIDGLGTTFCTALNGSLSCSMTSCK